MLIRQRESRVPPTHVICVSSGSFYSLCLNNKGILYDINQTKGSIVTTY